MVEKKKKIFRSVPIVPRKKKIKFFEAALVAVHCNCLTGCIMIACLFKFINKCTRTIGCCFASVFLKELEQISHSILVLLV